MENSGKSNKVRLGKMQTIQKFIKSQYEIVTILIFYATNIYEKITKMGNILKVNIINEIE